uniref:Uncharacterized protein n=1 Tax=Brugia malayi TaxID=6279 RepID=A8QFQ1_BRUMA
MAEAGWRLEELVGQLAMEENPVPQEPEFNKEEVEWALCLKMEMMRPRTGHQKQSGPLCQKKMKKEKSLRIPVPAMQEAMAAAPPEKFEPADLKDLPEQLPRELIVPQAEPYTGHKEKETRTSCVASAAGSLKR